MVVQAPRVEARVVGAVVDDPSSFQLCIAGIENFIVLPIW